MAGTLTYEQERAAREFIEKVNAKYQRKMGSAMSWSTAVRFLYARKFDVLRALALFEQHERTRLHEGLTSFDPRNEPLRSELLTGKFTILPHRDASNAAIAVFTAHKHYPQESSHQTTLQGVVYQLDVALQNPITQKAGIVFIYDMSNSKYSNFDYDLSQKILTLLKGGYPAKLKKVLIVTAPLWFKAPFKILRLFVREKLRERVFTVSVAQLLCHIPRESLPIQLGGSHILDHNVWLSFCLRSMSGNQDTDLPHYVGRCQVDTEKVIDLDPVAPTNGSCEWRRPTGNANVLAGENEEEEESELVNNGNRLRNGNNCQKLQQNGSPASSASSGFSDDDSLHGDYTAMTICQLVEHVRKSGRSGLADEYMRIRSRPPEGTFTVAKLKYNLPKNRYTDVLCYDHSRVILSEQSSARDSPTLESELITLDEETCDEVKTIDDVAQRRLSSSQQSVNGVVGINQDPSPVTASQEGESDSISLRDPNDYIHANFVDGYKQKNAFISTQGPLPKTTADFWRMIWEQHCLLIVMTTRVMERGRPKCFQYWDIDVGSESTYGCFTIKTISIEADPNYTVSTILIFNNKTDESREVCHLQFTSWPDYGVPDSAKAMLDFHEKVRQRQEDMVADLGDTWAGHPRGPPIVVHCSAGIGRTGTFCTLDICISRLKDVGTVDVRGTVERIRSQRAFSIQMPDQYIFCHLALIEYAIINKLLPAADLAHFSQPIEDDSD